MQRLFLCFSRNKSFHEILSIGEYKKMLVSRNSRLGFRVSKLDFFESIRLPDLTRRIEGPLLAGYQLVSNINFNQSINLFKVIAWD